MSPRRERLLVKVNCAAISAGLVESELFGHEKGAFTGALARRKGRFELAHGGTLFLDEVGELPLEMQAKLLRVLQEREFERVGGSETVRVDVRVVAATNKNLAEMVEAGRFREDLLYRLNVFPIHLPALRERASDVPLIAEHFLAQIGEREGEKKRFEPAVLERLAEHRWAGNVRELRNVVYREYVMATGSTIVDDCLPRAAGTAPALGGSPMLTIRIGTTLADVDRQFTLATLEHFGRHKEKTAATLGISLKTLYNRLKEYSSDDGDPVSEPGALDEAR
jgi:DNA-binding NtrC family response regulator